MFSKAKTTTDVDFIVDLPNYYTQHLQMNSFGLRCVQIHCGSRNILDLSKLGQIVEGSRYRTPYEYTDPIVCMEELNSFEIDPEYYQRKDITINYLEKTTFLPQLNLLL